MGPNDAEDHYVPPVQSKILVGTTGVEPARSQPVRGQVLYIKLCPL